MDFELVLKTLLAELDRQQIRYAAIGGFALGVLGVARATMDLDFLVHRDDLGKLHQTLTDLGYRRFVHTENVSQYRHPDYRWGSVDFVHAFRKAALGMLERSTSYPLPIAPRSLRVAEPEDIIGLKVQAMANDPGRRSQELADIERLVDFFRERLDWDRIQEYYELFDLGEKGVELRQKYGNPQ